MTVAATSEPVEDSPPPASAVEPAPRDAPFGRSFWLTYGANFSMMVAISLLFRYSDFVTALGGTDWELGWIVGIGMVGSLLMRIAQGVGIDRFGPRQIWLISSACFVASCLAHLAVTTVHSPLVYVLRVCFQTSIAGFFGASITFIAGRAPLARMAEVIGTLGTSGFVGMMVGPKLGDWLFGADVPSLTGLSQMFLVATGLGVVALVLSWIATMGCSPPAPVTRRRPGMLAVLRRYHPGPVLLVGVAMGFGLSLPGTFLRPYMHEQGISSIALFFNVYAPTAFATRLSIRRLPEMLGIRPVILIGMASLIGSLLVLPFVQTALDLVPAAVLMGVSHACLFPSVVAGGSCAFPLRYRGLGTTLVLAMFDLGCLIGQPAAGSMLRLARDAGRPAYPTMFLGVSVVLMAMGLAYFWGSRSRTAKLGE